MLYGQLVIIQLVRVHLLIVFFLPQTVFAELRELMTQTFMHVQRCFSKHGNMQMI